MDAVGGDKCAVAKGSGVRGRMAGILVVAGLVAAGRGGGKDKAFGGEDPMAAAKRNTYSGQHCRTAYMMMIMIIAIVRTIIMIISTPTTTVIVIVMVIMIMIMINIIMTIVTIVITTITTIRKNSSSYRTLLSSHDLGILCLAT